MLDVNISDLTVKEYLNMTPAQQQALRLKTIGTAGIADKEALKRRLIEYIHWGCIEQRPSRLMTLNRRFNRLAHKFESSVLVLLTELAADGLVHVFEIKNQMILATVHYLMQVKEAIPDASERAKARERFLAQAE